MKRPEEVFSLPDLYHHLLPFYDENVTRFKQLFLLRCLCRSIRETVDLLLGAIKTLPRNICRLLSLRQWSLLRGLTRFVWSGDGTESDNDEGFMAALPPSLVYFNGTFMHGSISSIRHLTALTSLKSGGNMALDAMTNFPRLVSLKWYFCDRLIERQLSHLSRFTQLERLSLMASGVCANLVDILHGFTRLQSLAIYSTVSVLPPLSTSLTSLTLQRVHLEGFPRSMEGLRSLVLHSLSFAGPTCISLPASLTSLRIRHAKMTSSIVTQNLACFTLKKLDVDRKDWFDLFRKSPLVSLKLRGNTPIESHNLLALAPTLKKLYLSSDYDVMITPSPVIWRGLEKLTIKYYRSEGTIFGLNSSLSEATNLQSLILLLSRHDTPDAAPPPLSGQAIARMTRLQRFVYCGRCFIGRDEWDIDVTMPMSLTSLVIESVDYDYNLDRMLSSLSSLKILGVGNRTFDPCLLNNNTTSLEYLFCDYQSNTTQLIETLPRLKVLASYDPETILYYYKNPSSTYQVQLLSCRRNTSVKQWTRKFI